MKRVVFVGVLVCLGATLAYAGLEVPGNGSNQSGITDIHGWFCDDGTYTYTIDNGPANPLVYGANRNDTIGPCGDANNGFVQQFNWNLIATGQHTIRIFRNGQQVDQATFTSTNIGTEFLTGASGSVSTILAGRDVTLTWQQGQQNYVITSATAAGDFTLSTLIGNWIFSYQIGSVLFTNSYDLDHLELVDGKTVLVGTGSASDPVLAARTADLSAQPFPYEFALLDPGSIICRFFVFNQTTFNTLAGEYFQFNTNALGECTNSGSGPYPMNGARVSTVVVTAQNEETEHQEQTAAQFVIFSESQDAESLSALTRAGELMQALQEAGK